MQSHLIISKCFYSSNNLWIQHFRNEWLSIMYENIQKNAIKSKDVPQLWVTSDMAIWKTFHNFELHLTCRYIKICVLIRHKFCESLVIHVLPNAIATHFCDIIFRRRVVLPICQKTVSNIKNLAKLIIYRIFGNFFQAST